MKNLILVLALSVYASSVYADNGPNLGTELGVMPNNQGNPALSVTFTYGDDPDGKSYLLSFTPALSPSEKSKHMLWNYYVSGSSDFLLPWDNQRQTQLAVIQVLVRNNPQVVEAVLRNQGEKNGQNMLFFVLADRNTKAPIYYLPLSKLCSDLPNNFKDLSNGSRCDQIANP